MDEEKKNVYSDEYTGPRFLYGLQRRPFGIGAQPKGFINGSLDEDDGDGYRFGTIEYPFKLELQTVLQYELYYVGELKKPPTNKEKAALLIKRLLEPIIIKTGDEWDGSTDGLVSDLLDAIAKISNLNNE